MIIVFLLLSYNISIGLAAKHPDTGFRHELTHSNAQFTIDHLCTLICRLLQVLTIIFFLYRVSNFLLNTRCNHRLAHSFDQFLHSIQMFLDLQRLVASIGEFSVNLGLSPINNLADVLLRFGDTVLDELMQVGGLGADAQKLVSMLLLLFADFMLEHLGHLF
jgi:hypothetical protein